MSDELNMDDSKKEKNAKKTDASAENKTFPVSSKLGKHNYSELQYCSDDECPPSRKRPRTKLEPYSSSSAPPASTPPDLTSSQTPPTAESIRYDAMMRNANKRFWSDFRNAREGKSWLKYLWEPFPIGSIDTTECRKAVYAILESKTVFRVVVADGGAVPELNYQHIKSIWPSLPFDKLMSLEMTKIGILYALNFRSYCRREYSNVGNGKQGSSLEFLMRVPKSSSKSQPGTTTASKLSKSTAEVTAMLQEAHQMTSSPPSTREMFFFGQEIPLVHPKLQTLMWVRRRAQAEFPENFGKLKDLSRYPNLSPPQTNGGSWTIFQSVAGNPHAVRLCATFLPHGRSFSILRFIENGSMTPHVAQTGSHLYPSSMSSTFQNNPHFVERIWEPFRSILKENDLTAVEVLLRYVCLVSNYDGLIDPVDDFQGDFIALLRRACEALPTVEATERSDNSAELENDDSNPRTQQDAQESKIPEKFDNLKDIGRSQKTGPDTLADAAESAEKSEKILQMPTDQGKKQGPKQDVATQDEKQQELAAQTETSAGAKQLQTDNPPSTSTSVPKVNKFYAQVKKLKEAGLDPKKKYPLSTNSLHQATKHALTTEQAAHRATKHALSTEVATHETTKQALTTEAAAHEATQQALTTEVAAHEATKHALSKEQASHRRDITQQDRRLESPFSLAHPRSGPARDAEVAAWLAAHYAVSTRLAGVVEEFEVWVEILRGVMERLGVEGE
ncbi:hypothetical protein BDW02DRAFT_611327 [Decorospora gaudefroyi]|uniref:Uncharacterized protein n=1 Tax=Decorospora gaudefroyi TaxID=184978 RepID=A0A6A5KVD3_9PLEO|nr:hypothetical protein BDW02DRAFT_611327 [Decorospora gaudefroyi]